MTYAVVQDFRASGAGSLNFATPPAGTISAGDCLAYFVYLNAATATAGVVMSDSAHAITNWVEVGNVRFSTGDELHWGYAANTPGVTTTLQATVAAGQLVADLGVYVVEFSGLDPNTPFLSGAAMDGQTAAPGTLPNAIMTANSAALAFGAGAVIFGVSINTTLAHHSAPLAGSTYTAIASCWDFGQGASNVCARPQHHRLLATQTPIRSVWSVDTTSLDTTGADTYLSMALVLAEPVVPPSTAALGLAPTNAQVIAGTVMTPNVA